MALERRGDRMANHSWKTGAIAPVPSLAAMVPAEGTPPIRAALSEPAAEPVPLPPQHALTEGLVYVAGAPDDSFNGIYALDEAAPEANGKTHLTNGAGCHLFCNFSGEWCLKDSFDPASNAARAFAAWPDAPEPVDGTSEWRWWASRWRKELITVTTGDAAAALAAEFEAAAEAALAEAPRRFEAEWGVGLSKEIVMVLLHWSKKRECQSIACVNTSWRDAAKERKRRPSVMLGPCTTETHGDWIAERRRMYPHSFG